MTRLSTGVLLVTFGCLFLLAFAAAGASSRGPSGQVLFVKNLLCQKWNDCGLGEIAVVDADGSGLRVLTHDKVTEVSPRWSPDGREIAYIKPDATGTGTQQVWLMSADGTHQHALTRLPQGVIGSTVWSSLDWSPDGSQIAFVAFPSRNGGAPSLYLVNVRTGATKLLLHMYVGVASGLDGPAWSPNGRWIVFTSLTRHGPYQIFSFSTTTRHLHRLRQGMAPAWSPDGRRIAFGSQRGLTVMAANGRHPHVLRAYGSDPSWSPDGKWIVFYDGSEAGGLAEIRPDGSGYHMITRCTSKRLQLDPDW